MRARVFKTATTEKSVGSTHQSLANPPVNDTEYLERALREYREASWNDSSFQNLPARAEH